MAEKFRQIAFYAVFTGLQIQSVIAPESSKEIKLTFKFVDGKFIPVIEKENNEDLDSATYLSTRAIASVFLLLLIMIGFIGNALIVGTVGSSIVLKRYSLQYKEENRKYNIRRFT